MKVKILLILILFILYNSGIAQKITITGRITDENRSPIHNIHVTDSASQIKTSTKRNGIFNLSIPKQKTILTFRGKGYEDVIKEITEVDFVYTRSDTIYIEIVLQFKEQLLRSVDITPGESALAYNKPEILILDYAFYKDKLVLLIKQDRSYKLRLIDEQSNILSDMNLASKPKRLIHDCYNNLLVDYENRFWEVVVNGEKLIFNKEVSFQQYNYYLNPCVCSTERYLYFQQFGLYNQTVLYFLMDKETRKQKLLKIIRDKEREQFAHFAGQQIKVLKGYGLSDIGQLWHETIDIVQETKQREWLYLEIQTRPTYNPMLKTDSSIIIFDHVHDSAYVYDYTGTEQLKYPIDYHHARGFANELISDYENKKVYVRHVRDGITYLSAINLTTGKIDAEFKIEKHIYPENVKMRNGVVYYLYNEGAGFSLTNLYKQPLR